MLTTSELSTQLNPTVARAISPLDRDSFMQSGLRPQTVSSDLQTDSPAPTGFLSRVREGLSALSEATNQAFSSLIYGGTATTTIGQVDPITGGFFNVRSNQTTAFAEISNQKSAGGILEGNPFSLSISSSSQEVSGLKEGAFSMFSAIPYNFRDGFLVQHWQYAYGENGQLSGQLTDTGQQYALATNLINVQETFAPSQLMMSQGTRIDGVVTSDSIQVRIQGTGVSLFSQQYVFQIDVVLSRQ